ncbi:MAG: hypothetical protein U0744_06660 [Gemmataceae bacterium]
MRLAAIIWMIAAAAWLRTAVVVADTPPVAPALPGVPMWESHGFGRTKEEARDDAFHHAAEALQAKVGDRRSDAAAWKPSDALVNSLVIDGFEGESIEVPPIGHARRWVLRLRMPAEASLENALPSARIAAGACGDPSTKHSPRVRRGGVVVGWRLGLSHAASAALVGVGGRQNVSIWMPWLLAYREDVALSR